MKIELLLSVIFTLTFSALNGDHDTPQSKAIEDGAFYNLRYCEVLIAKVERGRKVKAEVYNSMPCNQCPQEEWEKLDFNKIAREHDARKAIANGPRYWVMDEMKSFKTIEPCTETFGGIGMSKVATVHFSARKARKKSFYQPSEVDRNTNFHFKAGREVYILESSEGQCYIMQSYSQAVDETLQLADLKQLGDRLKLPKGWSFKTTQLKEDLNLVCPDGKAKVLNDNLKNTYQFLHEGCLD